MTGHVSTYAEKQAAERAAKRVKGVRAIVEEIDVKMPSSDAQSDEGIAAIALCILRSHAVLRAEQIQLKVENGELP